MKEVCAHCGKDIGDERDGLAILAHKHGLCLPKGAKRGPRGSRIVKVGRP